MHSYVTIHLNFQLLPWSSAWFHSCPEGGWKWWGCSSRACSVLVGTNQQFCSCDLCHIQTDCIHCRSWKYQGKLLGPTILSIILCEFTITQVTGKGLAIYLTAGNFGKVFNLVNWRFCGKSPKVNIISYTITLCGSVRDRQIYNSPMHSDTDSPNLMLAKLSLYTVDICDGGEGFLLPIF